MKSLSKIKLTARLVFITSIMNSQDTICFKTNKKVASQLVEIDVNTITYKLFQNLNGPTYVVNKADVLFIKFSNGLIDSIKYITQAIIIKQDIIDKPKIIIDDNRLTLNGITLRNRALKALIDNCSNPEQKNELQQTYHQMCNYDENRKVIAPLLLIAGLVPPIYATKSLSDNTFLGGNLNSQETMNVFIGSVLIGAVIRITACVFATVNKNKYWHQRNEIAKMDNQMR